MNRFAFFSWRDATGPAKTRALTKLVRDNEAMVESFASRFMANTRLYSDLLRDDVFQAARIGLVNAIRKWDPARGAFSTIAWYEMRYEMQNVMRDATPLTYPRRIVFGAHGQHRAEAFYAQYGREPTAEEVRVDPSDARGNEKAQARFVSVREAEEQAGDVPEPEADLDRARDVANLRLWLSKQTKKDQKEFWSGKRNELTAAAKRFVSACRRSRAGTSK